MTTISVTPHPAAGVGVTKAGPRGKGWVFEAGEPTDDLGANGEMYLDTETFIAYGPKVGGSWDDVEEVDLLAPADLAEAAKVAAEAAAAAAEADRVQTGLDRVQTNLDRIAAAASASLASTKAAQASDDADDTAADRVQTGLDRAAAETAATNAAASALGASGSATAAATSATNADTSEANALASANAADASADAAAADAVQTAADRVQTGLDRAAAEQAKDDAEAAAGSMTPVADQIVAATGKTTPVDADLVGLVDSAASNVLKKLTWANLKATLKTYFDTLYQVAGSYAAAVHTHTVSQLSDATANARSLLQSANYASMFGLLKQDATSSATGVVELATNAEVQTGTDTTRAVTAAGLASRTATETRAGVVELATDAETQTGTDAARAITPANLSARTATTTRTGLVELSTDAEMTTGTSTTVVPTVKQVADYVIAYVAANGGGSVNVQTGYVDAAGTLVAGTGEDLRYFDVTISAVSSVAACMVFFEGGSTNNGAMFSMSTFYTTSQKLKKVTARLINTTTLRLSSPGWETGENALLGRWQVVDFG